MKKSWSIAALLIALAFCVTTFDADLFNISSTSLVPVVNQKTIQLSPDNQDLAASYSKCLQELEQKILACNSISNQEEKCQCSEAAISQLKQCSPEGYLPEASLIKKSLFEQLLIIANCSP